MEVVGLPELVTTAEQHASFTEQLEEIIPQQNTTVPAGNLSSQTVSEAVETVVESLQAKPQTDNLTYEEISGPSLAENSSSSAHEKSENTSSLAKTSETMTDSEVPVATAAMKKLTVRSKPAVDVSTFIS